MFPIKCPRCSVVGYADVKCNCFYNVNDPKTKDPIERFQPTREEAVPKCTSEAIGSHNLDPIEIKTGSGDLVSNKKRKESQVKVRENVQNLKKCWQDVSEFRDENQCFLLDPNDRNKETRNTEYISVSGKKHSNDVHDKFPNFMKSPLNNRGMQEHSKLCEELPITNYQNINMKICIHGNDNARGENLDSIASNAEAIHSIGDILAVPGPSGLRGSHIASDSFGEKSQSRENEEKMCRARKTVTCRVCKKEIYEHKNISDKIISFSCCVCGYNTYLPSNLYLHTYIHCGKKTCKLCEKEYAEADWHKSEDKCKLCQEVFECTTSLDHHSLNHTEYYSSHCWGCSENLRNHLIKQKDSNLYECCVCGFGTRMYESFRNHNQLHIRNMFCKKCRHEYPIEEKSLHASASGFTCFVCKNKFPCNTLLEDHYNEYHKGYFDRYCVVCNGDLYDHRKEYGKYHKYGCCSCHKTFRERYQLQSHFQYHSNLKLYKCKVCGTRFFLERRLTEHSVTCMKMHYECEICSAKLPSKDCLERHSLEKHSSKRIIIQSSNQLSI